VIIGVYGKLKTVDGEMPNKSNTVDRDYLIVFPMLCLLSTSYYLSMEEAT